MKKRWIALLAAVCMVCSPVVTMAEETDYSYLEDMSVKELKALDAEIHKLLGDDGSKSSGSGEVTEEVFNNSKIAYEKLTEASEIGLNALSDIYDAWRYGIYEDDANWEDFCDELIVPDADIEKGIQENSIFYSFYKDDEKYDSKDMSTFFSIIQGLDDFWQECVNYVVYAYGVTENGFTVVEQDLNDAKASLKIVGDEFSDYKYYPNLKEFYSTVSSLYEFVSNPTGSFETLKTTSTDYENQIRSFKSDLSFVFEE